MPYRGEEDKSRNERSIHDAMHDVPQEAGVKELLRKKTALQLQ